LSKLVIWVDPLDGTKNYVSGETIGITSIFGVSFEGHPIFGAIHHPFDSEKPTYWGGRDIPLHKTTNAFKQLGLAINIYNKTPQNTVLSSKYHATPFIKNYLTQLPYTNLRVGGNGYKCTLVATAEHALYIFPVTGSKRWDI
jgi:3'-phosphoadenosine 5'-phosphosulfate (PAPS) 3'-phosphatase